MKKQEIFGSNFLPVLSNKGSSAVLAELWGGGGGGTLWACQTKTFVV